MPRPRTGAPGRCRNAMPIMTDLYARYHRLLNTTRWRALRASVLRDQDGLCRRCLDEGRVCVAHQVHHIVPPMSARTPSELEHLTYDRANLVGLCRVCHRRAHEELRSADRRARLELARRRAAAASAALIRAREQTGGVFFEPGEGDGLNHNAHPVSPENPNFENVML